MQWTQHKKSWLTLLIPLLAIILLHVIAHSGFFVENVYSSYIYPPIAYILRLLTCWFPFSIGDVLYIAAGLWVIIKIIKFFVHKPTWRKFGRSLRSLAIKCLWIYVAFLLLWALNYYRYGIGYKMDLIPERCSTADLQTVTAQLRDSLNKNRKLMDSLQITYPDNKTIFKEAAALYDTANKSYTFLKYSHHSIKPMMVGDAGNYGGFLGYYNPFTGEAQVNTTMPKFVIPFTTCHEIGHQLGFASESEASFAGYLAIRSGNMAAFNYSAYFDMFSYANGELYARDSVAAKQNIKLLDTLVKKDILAYRAYLKEYRNPLEPLLTKIYGNYLKAHNQPSGIDSYDEVVA